MAEDINGSDIEILVFNWLIRRGYIFGLDFDYQSQLVGGFGRQYGDVIADFVIHLTKTVLRVQGEYYHAQTEQKAKDQVQKEKLIGMGFSVVDLWEKDIKERIDDIMPMAIMGMQP